MTRRDAEVTRDPQDEAIERLLIASTLGQWAAAVEVQRARIGDRSATEAVNQLDAIFFAIAVRNVLRAAEWAKKLLPADVGREIERFEERVPRAQDVRDVLEHFDEYLQGTGKLQRQGKISNPTTFYVRYEDEFLLHLADDLELDVQSAAHAASHLADAVASLLTGQATRPLTG